MSRALRARAIGYRRALDSPAVWLPGQLLTFFALSIYVKLVEMQLAHDYGVTWLANEVGLFALLLASLAVWAQATATSGPLARAFAWTIGLLVLPLLSTVEVLGLAHFALFLAPIGPHEVRLVGWSGHFVSTASVLWMPTVAAGLLGIAVGYYVAPPAIWLAPALARPLRTRRSIGAMLVLGVATLAAPKPAHEAALLAPHPVLWLAFGGRAPRLFDSAAAAAVAPDRPSARPRFAPTTRPTNVLLLVLESTRAASVAAYDPTAPAGRELLRLRDEMTVFDQVYAPAPTSAHALFSMFYGVYPYLGPFWMGADKSVVVDSLAQRFLRAGYATHLYITSDLAYDDVRSFAARGFERVLDTNDWPGQERYTALPWGRDDRLLFDELERFLATRDTRPFFVTAMTSNPHHPYALDALAEATPASDPHAAYDRLVAYDLRLVAELYRWMKDYGVAEQTLLVVVGDHGEAFGEHAGNFGHAAAIYEENTHVPCFILHPRRLGLPAHIEQLGSEVDLRATILDIVGMADGEAGDGMSLLWDDPARSIFHFTENGVAHFGVRDRDFTYIVTPHAGAEKLFDRRRDPRETRNVAPDEPSVTARYRGQLARWEQQHALRLARVLR